MERKIIDKNKFIMLLSLFLLLGVFLGPNISKSINDNQSSSTIFEEKIFLGKNELSDEIVITSTTTNSILDRITKIQTANKINPVITTPTYPPPPSNPFYYLDTNLMNYFNLPLIHDFSNEVFGSNGYTGEGITVAVLDEGVAYNHPYFSAGYTSLQHSFIITSFDGISETPLETENDYNTHATSCASLVKQIAPKADIISVGPRGGLPNVENSKGVFKWLLNNYLNYNIKIVSRSIGYQGSTTTPTGWEEVEQIIKYLSGNGPHPDTGLYIPEDEEILFVFPSGNNYNPTTQYDIHWPSNLANLPNIICIGQVDFDGNKIIANGGFDSIQNVDVENIIMECMSPARNIIACTSENSEGPVSESSTATPIVAGALALALEKYGTTNTKEIEILIRGKTVNPLGDFYSINKVPTECIDEETGVIDFELLKKYYGFGIVNIAGMLDLKDSDSDGLTDYFEYFICDSDYFYEHPLNPWNDDTDGDLMTDGWEVFNGLCPLTDDALLDPDSDGLLNLYEFDANTNPHDEDTDDDTLDDHEEITGVFVTDTTDPNAIYYTWCWSLVVPPYVVLLAQTNPLDEDPDDDTITDKQECDGHQIAVTVVRANGIINEINTVYKTNPNNDDSDYDGLTDIEEITGVTIWTYDEGTIHQIFNIQTIPVIADMDGDGLEDGEEVNGVIDPNDPNNRIYSDPRKYDTDGDGISDNDEINSYYTNPLNPDTDGDLLGDFAEIDDYNTDPLDTDTDDDGWDDFYEVHTSGTDPTLADTDNDDLFDPEEQNYNTDPNNADCDSDGLLDGEEVNVHFTDPLDSDSDNDFLDDGEEVNVHFTDPLDSDTDNDGMDDLYEVINNLNPLSDDSSNDPDNDDCTNIEEYSYGTDPHLSDTDGDGMPDGWEISYSLNPLNDDATGDSDGDGLHNVSEYNNDCDPTDPDSDNDGLNDHQEILNNCDPNDTDSDNDGWNDYFEVYTSGTEPDRVDTDYDGLTDKNEFNYWKYTRGRTTSQAYAYCKNDDVDNDNLEDGAELAVGCDPLDNDSDNDGLYDGSEDLYYDTDPTDYDSDNDGYSDGEEVAAGSDPNDPNDTPGGGGFGW